MKLSANWMAACGPAEEDADLREAVDAIRGLVAAGIYDHPQMHARLGYAPQPYLERMTAERLARFEQEARAAADRLLAGADAS